MRFWVNGVDLVRLSKKTPFSLPTEWKSSNRFLTVSRLVRWKRVDRVLETLSALKYLLGVVDFHVMIVGDGEEKRKLEELSQSLGLEANVSFIGSVGRDTIVSLLSSATLLFSMYDGSNVGNPLLESLAVGLPVVTLSNGDTDRWIRHNENGLIYSPISLSPKEVAKDVMKLITTPEFYDAVQNEAKATGQRLLYTWDDRFDKEEKAVSSLLVSGTDRQ